MDIKETILNHYKRWNIEFDVDQAFIQLKNRVIGTLTEYFPQRPRSDRKFAYLCGHEVEVDRQADCSNDFSDSYLYEIIRNTANVKELATALQFFLIALELDNYSELSDVSDAIILAIDISPGAGIRVKKQKPKSSVNSVIFYPTGARLLDQGTVNDVLEWLEKYPKIAKHFEQSLKIYYAGDSGKYRNLLDNLRFALEQLLKEVLDNESSLENQKTNLLSWLQQRGIHQEIINLYHQLLFGQYCMYQNNAVKHNESFSENDIEFMIYLTGTFMRLLLQVNKY
jgi:hypothetical protein